MAITAASIEANGWVLRLDVTGSLGGFATYTLDANSNPRVTLASAHPGFVKSAGTAVAGNLARGLIATKPLRKPVNWNGSGIDAFVVDEMDLGGGIIRVRLALSEHIYATESGSTLSVAAGWRAGESAASGIAVTNNSTCVAPIPIMRWALAPYEITSGAFRVSLLVFSHHPVGFEPVAGVRFIITDGTTTKTVWATQLGTDDSYADNLRCYTAIIDPATATALTAGLLRCDAEIYPWLGTMRTTDPAGTRSLASLRTDGFSINAAAPWVIGYDPAGTRYSAMFALVDPINGTATAAAAMVATTLAAARAVAPALRPVSINTAIQAGYLTNRTLPAANGQAAQTRSVDGMQIILAAGTHVGAGATAVTSGLTTAEIPLRIVGDPADGNPRANVILQTGANVVSRAMRHRLQNLNLQVGTTLLLNNPVVVLFDNVEVVAKAGQEGNGVAPIAAAAAPTTQWNLGLTRSRWWKTATTAGSGNIRAGFVRSCQHARPISSVLFAVKNRLIGSVEDGFVGAGTLSPMYIGWQSATLPAQAEDVIIAWNDMRFLRGRAWTPGTLPPAAAGTPNPSIRRHVFCGNVCERIGTDPQPFYSLGEDASATMSYNIIEGNSFIGERANTFYSDPLPTTVAEANTLLNQAFVNRVANNILDWLPTKQDAFFDSTTAGLRGNANGYRPHMVEAWSMLYGVGHEGNVLTERAAESPGTFALEFTGPRSIDGYGGVLAPLYTDDRSIRGPLGAAAPGGGNYRPLAGSPVAGRGVRANADVDGDSVARPMSFAAGAFQTPVELATNIVPATAAMAHRAAVPIIEPRLAPAACANVVRDSGAGLAWAADIMPAAVRHPTRAGLPVVTWSASVAAADAAMAHLADTSLLTITFSLAPAAASNPLRSTAATAVISAPAALVVADGRQSSRGTMPLLLVPGAPARATLVIGPDPRILIPNRN